MTWPAVEFPSSDRPNLSLRKSGRPRVGNAASVAARSQALASESLQSRFDGTARAAFHALVIETVLPMWRAGNDSLTIAYDLWCLHPNLWETRAEAEAAVVRALAGHRGGERG